MRLEAYRSIWGLRDDEVADREDVIAWATARFRARVAERHPG